jgi:hypothetical protein
MTSMNFPFNRSMKQYCAVQCHDLPHGIFDNVRKHQQPNTLIYEISYVIRVAQD